MTSRLFPASCVALIATAMSFAIRGDIMGDFERVFGLSATDVGWIAGAAFWGFGLSMALGGPLCDALGMKTLARLAAVGHIGGTLLTIFASNFAMLFTATLVIGIANGLVEAFVNPLIATLYPQDKTSRLVALHAWFPGGIVIGGLIAFAFTQLGLGWQAKMLLLVIPSVIYTVMFARVTFPKTESAAAGVSFGGMFAEVGRPLFLLIWVCMWLTAATELGPGQWYANIFNEVMQSGTQAGIILLVWVNGIMYAMRHFFGHIPHRVSPTLLIVVTAPISALGLYLFGQTSDGADVVFRGSAAGRWHGILVADNARDDVGAIPSWWRAGTGHHWRVRLDLDRTLGACDGMDQRHLWCARGAADVGGPPSGADRDLPAHLLERPRQRRLPGRADSVQSVASVSIPVLAANVWLSRRCRLLEGLRRDDLQRREIRAIPL